MTSMKMVDTYAEDSYACECYIAYEGDTEVGSASVLVDDSSAYVERIDIFDGFRGQGHGTAFLQALAAAYGSILVSPDNEGAQRLYERLGRDVTMQQDTYDQGYGVYEI